MCYFQTSPTYLRKSKAFADKTSSTETTVHVLLRFAPKFRENFFSCQASSKTLLIRVWVSLDLSKEGEKVIENDWVAVESS